MKKLTSLLLALCLAFSLAVPAFAANDVVWSQDTTLTRFINRYDNATVKAGVTLTMKVFQPDPQGLEITKSLTVEDGGTITGGGCIIFSRGATCSGLPLYYRVAGVEKPLTVTLAEVVASDPNADYYPTFLYDSATGHYVLVADFSNDPFEQPAPPPRAAAQTRRSRRTPTGSRRWGCSSARTRATSWSARPRGVRRSYCCCV